MVGCQHITIVSHITIRFSIPTQLDEYYYNTKLYAIMRSYNDFDWLRRTELRDLKRKGRIYSLDNISISHTDITAYFDEKLFVILELVKKLYFEIKTFGLSRPGISLHELVSK